MGKKKKYFLVLGVKLGFWDFIGLLRKFYVKKVALLLLGLYSEDPGHWRISPEGPSRACPCIQYT